MTETLQDRCTHLALTLEVEVYSWGYNGSGQVSNVSCVAHVETDAVKISGFNGFDKKIISVVCGGWTLFALDDEGNVISQKLNCLQQKVVVSSSFMIGVVRFGLGVTSYMEHWDLIQPMISLFREKSHLAA